MIATPGRIAQELLSSLSPTSNGQSDITAKQEVSLDALTYLAPEEREVLLLFYRDGRDYDEIATKMQCDYIAARKLRAVAFQRFIGVLRKRRLVRTKRGKWYLHPGTKGPGQPKPIRRTQPIMPKWPASVMDAYSICPPMLRFERSAWPICGWSDNGTLTFHSR